MRVCRAFGPPALAFLLASGCGRFGYALLPSTGDAGVDAACTVASPVDYCTELPSLAQPPVLDGQVDCGLALHDVAPVGWYALNNASIPAGTAARYAVAWR